MTVVELGRVLRRRWYVCGFGVLCTLGVAYGLLHVTPTYSTRTEVRFVEPGVDLRSAFTTRANEAIVPFVLAVERVVNGGDVLRLNSQDAALVGLKVGDGTRVALPNYGSQWIESFPIPSLIVETVGSTPEAAIEARSSALAEVERVATALQQSQGIGPGNRITAVADAAPPEVDYAGASRSGQARALVAVALVGTAWSFWLAARWDRLAASRAALRSSRAPKSLDGRHVGVGATSPPSAPVSDTSVPH